MREFGAGHGGKIEFVYVYAELAEGVAVVFHEEGDVFDVAGGGDEGDAFAGERFADEGGEVFGDVCKGGCEE